MPSSSQPPLPPTGNLPVTPPPNSGAAPPANATAPAVPLPLPGELEQAVEKEEQELNKLNPFVVMQKHPSAVSTPAAGMPLPGAPVQPTIDREALLKQAATAPSITFILPTQSPAKGVPTPTATAPEAWQSAEMLKKGKEYLTGVRSDSRAGQPVVATTAVPTPAGAVITPATPVVPAPAPAPTSPAPTPAASTTPEPAKPSIPTVPGATIPAQEKSAKKASSAKTLWLAGAGVLIALIILAASGYFLAASGTRLPLVYGWVSGLKTTGTGVAADALAGVRAMQDYQASGSISIAAVSENSKPSLPSDTNQAAVPQVTALKVTVPSGEPLTYEIKNGSENGRLNLAIGGSGEVPVYYATDGSSDGGWMFYLPANTQPTLISESGANLKQTLLYPLFQPLSLADLLKSAQTETGYARGKTGSSNTARYNYNLDSKSLAKILPTGASISGATGQVEYAWKTAQPIDSSVNISFTYQNVKYQLSETWQYQKWDVNEGTLTQNSNLSQVINSLAGSPSPSTLPDFVSQLGVVSLDALPHTTTASTTPVSVTAITPTGEGITAVEDPITAVPPIPVVPASDAAKARDVQRLADLNDLKQALNNYKQQNGSYPVIDPLQQTRSSAALLKDLVPTYLTKLPVDPLADTYWYEYLSGNGQSFILRSVAEDSGNSQAVKGNSFYYYQVTN